MIGTIHVDLSIWIFAGRNFFATSSGSANNEGTNDDR
jgi:hypothetical protein